MNTKKVFFCVMTEFYADGTVKAERDGGYPEEWG